MDKPKQKSRLINIIIKDGITYENDSLEVPLGEYPEDPKIKSFVDIFKDYISTLPGTQIIRTYRSNESPLFESLPIFDYSVIIAQKSNGNEIRKTYWVSGEIFEEYEEGHALYGIKIKNATPKGLEDEVLKGFAQYLEKMPTLETSQPPVPEHSSSHP